jgi:hypothetical protein
MSVGHALRPTDLDLHAGLRIPPELLALQGVRRVTDQEAKELLTSKHHGNLAGVVYPYHHPITGQLLTYRLRRDHPEVENGNLKDKYLSAYGDRRHLYFPLGAGEILTDVSVPVVFNEAEKSGLAVTAAATRSHRPILAIGTGGISGWRGRIGKTTDASGKRVDERGPSPDFSLVAWAGRDVILLGDANVADNPASLRERRALADHLVTQGARVRAVTVPVEDGINGPDDYVGKHGDEALFALIDGARPMQPASAADVLRLAQLDNLHGLGLTDLEGRFRLLKDLLQGADALRRRTVRELLVAALKAVKVSGAAALVDAAISGFDEPDLGKHAPDFLADEVPWHDQVDGAALLDETATRIRRHIVLTEAQADAGALWIGASHAIDGLQRMPMLLFSSHAPECGKTTAATLLTGLAPRSVMVSSLTPAVLFRLIDRYRPTLIADEVDSWLNDEKSELRGVFNCAHWRSGAVIPRCQGDDHEVRLFNVFGAKVLAMIGLPAPTMLSRCITITLHRKTAKECVDPLREDLLRADLTPLRQQWRRWAADHGEKLGAHDPTMPADLPVNRASDNWRPLISIADLAGGEWPARARYAACALSGVRVSEDEPVNVALLADVREVFKNRHEPDYLSSEDIIVALKALDERPWADWNRGRGLSAAQLANRLRGFGTGPLGLRTRKTRLDAEKTAQRWHRQDFLDAWSRYLTSETVSDRTLNPEHPEQTNKFGPEPANSNPERNADIPVSKMTVQPMFPGLVLGVPGSEPEKRERTRV